MSKNTPITLATSEPIDDGGRKYNILYFLGGIIGGISGIFLGGFLAAVFFALLGLFAAMLIKMKILDIASHAKLREMKFEIKNQIPFDQLIQRLQPHLLPLRMQLEKDGDRAMTVLYDGVIYDVTYNEDGTFGIWWRLNVAQALTKMRYITLYRKIVAAMGIIGYYTQQVTKNGVEE